MFKYEWWGLTPYDKSYNFMKSYESSSLVLGLEHPEVITLGARSVFGDDIKADGGKLSCPVYSVDRGGHATLHSPGQLVIYPLMDLKVLGLGPKAFVHLLMQTTERLFQSLGVSVFYKENRPGLYTSDGKICFVGLRIRKGRTSHGISININNDVKLFQKLRPCGVWGEPLTTLQSLGVEMEPQEFFVRWCKVFNSAVLLTEAQPNSNVAPLEGVLRA